MYQAPLTESSFALQSLLEYLEKEYYKPVEHLCSRITDTIVAIHGGDQEQAASLYTSLSKKLVDQVTRYVRLRRLSLVPYLTELVEKEENGHDCRSCSTSCTIRHSSQIADIHEAHKQIRETLGLLRAIEAPIACENAPVPLECQLRKLIANMDEELSELLYLEETALVPKITDAQKAIYAHS
jgi:hypothetical protein